MANSRHPLTLSSQHRVVEAPRFAHRFGSWTAVIPSRGVTSAGEIAVTEPSLLKTPLTWLTSLTMDITLPHQREACEGCERGYRGHDPAYGSPGPPPSGRANSAHCRASFRWRLR